MQHVYTTCFVQQNKCVMQQKLFHEMFDATTICLNNMFHATQNIS